MWEGEDVRSRGEEEEKGKARAGALELGWGATNIGGTAKGGQGSADTRAETRCTGTQDTGDET